MTSVPITVLLYDGLLLCSFNVAIKWLWNWRAQESSVINDFLFDEPTCKELGFDFIGAKDVYLLLFYVLAIFQLIQSIRSY